MSWNAAAGMSRSCAYAADLADEGGFELGAVGLPGLGQRCPSLELGEAIACGLGFGDRGLGFGDGVLIDRRFRIGDEIQITTHCFSGGIRHECRR